MVTFPRPCTLPPSEGGASCEKSLFCGEDLLFFLGKLKRRGEKKANG